eukprot:GHVU01111878.1.p1 GENE.GHVU01111878.1~~GHVU01111878.1.p1  ORF type:complete len:114 (-),score=8.21 GHVU01111878.1:73-414(-)
MIVSRTNPDFNKVLYSWLPTLDLQKHNGNADWVEYVNDILEKHMLHEIKSLLGDSYNPRQDLNSGVILYMRISDSAKWAWHKLSERKNVSTSANDYKNVPEFLLTGSEGTWPG